jgi:hypothetical protein
VPIPRELTLMLSASVQQFPGPTLVTNGKGKPVGPWIIDRAVRKCARRSSFTSTAYGTTSPRC